MHALTTTEAAALTGLDERAVRKDVEHGILRAGSPPRFTEAALVYLRACASFAFHLETRDRRRLHDEIVDALARGRARVDLGPGWTLDVAGVACELRERLAAFEEWRAGIVTREDVLAGEPTFAGTRLAVRRIGELLLRGTDPAEVRADHPELTDRDLEFARLYTVAYPRLGRPRGEAAAR